MSENDEMSLEGLDELGIKIIPQEVTESFIDIFIDIETLPDGDMPTPDEVPVPGNYSKPETIRAYQEANVINTYLKRSLISTKGKVLCIVVYDTKNRQYLTFGSAEGIETEVLNQFNTYILSFTEKERYLLRFVGFNIAEFDLTWLKQRAWKYAYEYGRYLPHNSKSSRLIDLMSLFSAYKYKEYISQDAVCEYLGIGQGMDTTIDMDTIDGSMVYDAFKAGKLDLILQHCLVDVQKLVQIYNKIK